MSTKPTLHLSLSPQQPPRPPRSTSPSRQGEGGSGRRITSWGSATSESFVGVGDHDMTPLPSPLGPLLSREDSWQGGSLSRSLNEVARARGSSIGSDTSAQSHAEPTRSKTASFFSPVVGGFEIGALSPPPNPPSNPPSRSNSLADRKPRRSWLDPIEDHVLPAAPPLPRTSESPAQSPLLKASTSHLPAAPSLELSSSHQSPPPPSSSTNLEGEPSPPPLPTVAAKPQLPAIQTALRESHLPSRSSSISSLPSASRQPLSSLPSGTSETPALPRPSARFLNFGPPSRFGTIDVHPGVPAVAAVSSPSRSTSGLSTRVPTPTPSIEEIDDEPVPDVGVMIGEYRVEKVLGKGSFSLVVLGRWKGKEKQTDSKDVALKLISRKSFEGNERMKISVVREIEVLKRINHPSLVTLMETYTTSAYNVLVLDYAPGGELFDFLAEWHSQMTEPLVRRIFGELCLAVGWMHTIFLVHRDIKLENVLLTYRPFPSLSPDSVLDTLPSPFVKLTDFGLSRFISPSSPLLSTRCGSEAYAAPELIMGRKYDGRRTDAWALGVVLFALITGGMPFVEDAMGKNRKAHLLKIAKGDYHWPSSTAMQLAENCSPDSTSPTPTGGGEASPVINAVSPEAVRLVTPEVKALVARLLVRDAEKRAKVDDVWDMDWMKGEGRPPPVEGWVSEKEDGDPLEQPWSREH